MSWPRTLHCLWPLLATLALSSSALAQSDFPERFERAWTLVAERYWGLDESWWQSVGESYRVEARSARSEEEFYQVVSRMYEELGDDHSVFVPPTRLAEIRASYGDLPCLPLLAQQQSEALGRFNYREVEGFGYLRIPDLASAGVAARTRAAVRELEAAGVDGLVLDLRGNPGGRLLEMMQVAGVFTRGFLWRVITNWSLPLPYPALGNVETDLPLAILTDGGVNSAAEGLAGALQNKGRALVVGEVTAGNVEAVLPFCLRDGSQAWIATGVLAPIGAATWEGVGVRPDVEVDAEEALETALRHLRER